MKKRMKKTASIAIALMLLVGIGATMTDNTYAATKYIKIKRTTYNTMKSTISSQKKTISSQKSTITSYKAKVADRDATIKDKNSTISWLYRNMETQGMHYSKENHAWVPDDGTHDSCTAKDCPFWYIGRDGNVYHMSPDQITVFEHQEAREWLEE